MVLIIIKFFNKWVKYCVEYFIQVSFYVELLKKGGVFDENYINEKLDIFVFKFKELEKFLFEDYI